MKFIIFKNRERGPDPDSLQVVEVPIMSKCKYVNDREGASVCAGETIGLKDACQVRALIL